MNVQTRQRSLATPYDNTTSKCRGGGGWDYLPYSLPKAALKARLDYLAVHLE